jgi:hypothetical protein
LSGLMPSLKRYPDFISAICDIFFFICILFL